MSCVRGCRPFVLMDFFFHSLQKSHLFSFICNRVSCGFHSEKSRGKTNDLQQVAMAVNKHLMRAGGFFFFCAWQPNKTPGESNRLKKHWEWRRGGEAEWFHAHSCTSSRRSLHVFQISGKKKKKIEKKESQDVSKAGLELDIAVVYPAFNRDV